MTDPIIIHIPGEAVPFARAGSNGPRRFTPAKQRNAMAVIRDFAARAMDGAPPLDGPLHMQVRAAFLVPSSWSKRKAAAARWKTSRPDIGNLIKLAEDALNTIVYVDDAQICWSEGQKTFGPLAGLTITVTKLEGDHD